MKNIQFNYRYRDAGNYKVNGSIIFANPKNHSVSFLETELRKKLIDSKFFEPEDLKVPRLRHEDFPYDPELDHSWNEFDSFEETELPVTDQRPVEEFVR